MKVIKLLIEELIVPAVIVSFIGVIALSVLCYWNSTNSAICYPIEIWINSCVVMDFFLPLFVTFPFSLLLYIKRKNQFIKYIAIRVNRNKYVKYQKIVGMIVSATITFLIYYIALLLSVFVFFDGSNSEREYILLYAFGRSQAENPLLFGVIWCVWKGVVASLFTHFGYQLALWIDNIFVVAITPFIYIMAENLITGILQVPQFSVMSSYVLNRLSPNAMKEWSYIVGIIAFVIETEIIVFVLKSKKEKQYEDYVKY